MTDLLDDEALRAEAMRRLKERRDFATHLLTYVLFNGVLVAIWALSGQGYFWPGWILGFWGIAIVLHVWTAFVQRPISGADLDREVERLRHRSGGAHA